jgi:hypothetical protein
MDRMSDEEKFDRWLKEAAESYNLPPARVPRDEMWEVVVRGLRESAIGDRRSETGGATRRGWRTSAWGALAASLVLAAGIGIGYALRGTMAPAGDRPAAVATTDSVLVPGRSLDVAMMQHLSNAEALLVAYRGNAGAADGHVHDWARDVLSTTRLLLDSRVGADPLRRRLHEDLEQILVQNVQLPGGVPGGERELIDRTLDREQLLTRLRTTIPAGPARGT